MKALPLIACTLLLSASFFAAHSQGLPAVKTTSPDHDKAAIRKQTANRRAAAYTGPKVVKDTKALGTKMLRDSKPAPKQVAPAKQ